MAIFFHAFYGQAATLVVGFQYPTVRAAYAAAADGDIIQVPGGALTECAGEFFPPKRVTFEPLFGIATITTGNCRIPENDYFLRASVLTGTNAQAAADNADASLEAGESIIYVNGRAGAGKSLWWRWTAPTDGLVFIESTGSSSDHLVAVFIGDVLSELITVTNAYVKQTPSNNKPIDQVFFQAVGGTMYSIAVDTEGFGSAQIRFQLSFLRHPDNDAMENARVLDGEWATDTGSTLAANADGEPNPFGPNDARKTVWWVWTAPPSSRPNRPAVITTAGSAFDTFLAIYERTPTGLMMKEFNDDFETERCNDPFDIRTLSSAVNFPPTPGATYLIQVDGWRAEKPLLPGHEKLLMQYAGDVRVTVDYSALNIVDTCHYYQCETAPDCTNIFGELLVTHYGDRVTRPLRITLLASNGFNRTIGFSNSTNSIAKVLTNLFLPAPSTLLPGHSQSVSYTNIAFPGPDPSVSSDDSSSGFGFAKGWGVYAVLEEQHVGGWLPVDSTLILYGSWPRVDPFGGPNGGVIRSDPSQPQPESLRSVRIEGPVVLYDRQVAEYRAFARFKSGALTNAEPDWSATGPLSLSATVTTNLLVTVNPVTADTTATLSAALYFAGSTKSAVSNITILNHSFELRQARAPSGIVRLEFSDVPGASFVIEKADSLSWPVHWEELWRGTNDASGSGVFTNALPSAVRQRFYRARELP